MQQEDRLNLQRFGWANHMLNLGFIAGRMRRSPENPHVVMVQQTPAIEQSIPIYFKHPLSLTQFPDGTYISAMARVGGRSPVDAEGRPTSGFAILEGLHVRYAEGREVDPDVAMARLQAALARTPSDARISDLKAMDIIQPPEVTAFASTDPKAVTPSAPEEEPVPDQMEKDPNAIGHGKGQRMLKGSNVIKIAGFVGFMEYRPPASESSGARLTLWVQQHDNMERAMPVRIYGRQATAAVNTYTPGHAIYVFGELNVDVKRGEGGALHLTPYIKTNSIENAQSLVHIRGVMPEWGKLLWEKGKTKQGYISMTRQVNPKDGERKPTMAQAATATPDAASAE